MPRVPRRLFLFLLLAASAAAQQYDLLLKGGHVIDPKNKLSARRDVAIAAGRIAAVAPNIPASQAYKVVDVSPLYVTPGLVDIHTHVDSGSGLRGSLPVEQNVYPDSHAPRSGVTTVVDAGSSGWRNFPQFKEKIIDYSKTRVLAMLNIVGGGQGGGETEQNPADMDPQATAAAAKRFRDVVVGVKTAHYRGPEWVAVERAVEAGTLAGIPVMVDFGAFHPARPFQDLVLKKLRPGDIYTHTYLNSVPMLDDQGRVQRLLDGARFDDLDILRPASAPSDGFRNDRCFEPELGSFSQTRLHLAGHAKFTSEAHLANQDGVGTD